MVDTGFLAGHRAKQIDIGTGMVDLGISVEVIDEGNLLRIADPHVLLNANGALIEVFSNAVHLEYVKGVRYDAVTYGALV